MQKLTQTTQHNTTQHRQDWEPPQVKDLRLVIPKDYLFMSDNTISYALGIPDSYLEKTTLRASLIFCMRGMSWHLKQRFIAECSQLIFVCFFSAQNCARYGCSISLCTCCLLDVIESSWPKELCCFAIIRVCIFLVNTPFWRDLKDVVNMVNLWRYCKSKTIKLLLLKRN